MQKTDEQRNSTLLISPTRKLRDKINNKIRIELKKENILKGMIEEYKALRQKDMTITDLRFAPSFSKDDVIKFNTNYSNGINKGDYFTVIKTHERTNCLMLEKNGKRTLYRLKKNVSYENKFEAFEKIDLKLQEGLKIRFTKNNKKLGLINSETAVIQTIDKDGIVLKLEDGSLKNIPKSQLKHIDYGYCITIHSAQGKTFDSTIAAISANKLLNYQKSWLVTLSRHKSEFTAIVQNKGKLEAYLMKNKGNEVSAMELVSQTFSNPNFANPLSPSQKRGNITDIKEAQMQI